MTSETWRRQAAAIVRMELRKNFITKRGFWIYGLAAAPVILVWLHSIVAMQRPDRSVHDLSNDTNVLAGLFNMFFLRPAVYFGCVGIFTWLFRGEVMEKSLHYYFLSPVRRDVLVLAKYIAGVITAVTFFGLSIVLTFWGTYVHQPSYEVSEWLYNSSGLAQLGAYTAITVLACLSWGAVCLWIGIRWKNPIIPSVTFLLWETLNVFLPSWVRPISVLHYLQSMTPVHIDLGGPGILLGQTADPVPVWLALLCLAGITSGMLWLSVRELKRMEISYSSD